MEESGCGGEELLRRLMSPSWIYFRQVEHEAGNAFLEERFTDEERDMILPVETGRDARTRSIYQIGEILIGALH